MVRTIAKDHDQKRAQILKSAARVFAEEGYDRASMSLLARECGISKANIYHYYDSKDALLFDLLDTYLSDLRETICATELKGLPPEVQLRKLVAKTLKAYEGADDEHRVQGNAMRALSEAQQEVLNSYQRDMVKQMAGVLRQNAPDIFDSDPARLHASTMSVFGMLNWFYMWNSRAGAEAREEYANLVTDLTLKGLRGL